MTFTYYDWFVGNQSILSEVWYEKITVGQLNDFKSTGLIFMLIAALNDEGCWC